MNALQNLIQYYRDSTPEDFGMLAGRQTRGLALWSVIEHTRQMRAWASDDYTGHPDEWSMQSGMVGRNAAWFNYDVIPKIVTTYPGYFPISWRKTEWFQDEEYVQ